MSHPPGAVLSDAVSGTVAKTDIQTHLDERTLAAFLSGTLPEGEAASVRAHVERCDQCRNRARDTEAFDVGGTAIARTATGDTARSNIGPRAPSPRLARGSSLGRYVVLDRLGEGGMGQVYAAFDPELNRKVAIKLLRTRRGPGDDVEEDQARLLREAQAMARLSHPNVVAVHDVGAFQEGVFIAMEMIDGQTLSDWIHEKRPGWREILGCYLQAGRGLAAAHLAGMVHRDFKPQNVLMGNDGRVFVTDFGLARAAGASGEVPRRAVSDEVPVSSSESDMFAAQLTLQGTVMGTPGYMSPEQMRGAAVEPSSDQFSFCVALYESLSGNLPFAGESLRTLTEAVEQKAIAPLGRKNFPAWLIPILLRGLEPRPDDRFPSLEALLQAIERRLRRQRQVLVLGGGLAALAVGFGASLVTRVAGEAKCRRVANQIERSWNPQAKASIERAFEASNRAYARDAWSGTEKTLDAWARDWSSIAIAVCHEGLRDPKAELPKLQQACLNDRLTEAGELTRLFAGADAELVASAVMAATSITTPRRCQDSRTLMTSTGSSTRASPERLAELRSQLARIRALRKAGRYADGVEKAKALVGQVRDLQSPALLADAEQELGNLQIDSGEMKTAIETLESADVQADASGQDWSREEIATSLAYANYLAGDFKVGLTWVDRARGRLSRIGGDEGLEAILTKTEANLLSDMGRHEKALGLYDKALSLMRSAYGDEDPKVALVLLNLSSEQTAVAQPVEALATAREAVRMAVRIFGEGHPDTIRAQGEEAITLSDLGKDAEALAISRKCLEGARVAFGPDHFRVAEAADRVSFLLLNTGDAAGALTYARQAEAIYKKATDDDALGVAQCDEAGALHDLGRRDEAWQAVRASLANIERSEATQEDTAAPLSLMSEMAAEERNFTEARDFAQRAVAAEAAALGEDNLKLAGPLTLLGEALLGLGDAARAAAPLERAMKLEEEKTLPSDVVARTRYALARAKWARGDRSQSLQLARQALKEYATGARRRRNGVEQVQTWLDSHAT